MKQHIASFWFVPLLLTPVAAAQGAAVGSLGEVAELLDPGAAPGEFVGWSVAVDGDTVVVGDAPPSFSIEDKGAAFVYTRDGGVWAMQAKLVPVGATYPYSFGTRMAIDGDTLAAGSGYEDGGRGALYVFERTGSVWDAGQRITVPSTNDLGSSVDIEGDRMAVGASGDGTHGAVFVLERTGSGWTVQHKLVASDPHGADRLGASVALQGDTLVAGAPNAGHSGNLAGRVTVFTFDGTAWSQTAVIRPSDPRELTYFGDAVALDGDLLAVGAPASNFPPIGSAYLFSRASGMWQQVAKLASVTGSNVDRFGSALDLRGKQLVVGAHIAHGGTGAAYLFEPRTGDWHLTYELEPSTLDPGSRFGLSVALAGRDLVVGAPYGSPAGSAYVFDLEPTLTFNYCIAESNSTGAPSVIGRSGSVSVATNDFVLTASGCPPHVPGLFICSRGYAQIPMLKGYLCVSPYYPGLVRLGPAAHATSAGLVTHALDFGNLPLGAAIEPGSTWYFQLWHRDSGPGGYGLSDGLGATFLP